jgi:hypothetical protein
LKEKQQPQEEQQQKGNENKYVGSKPKRGKLNRKMLLWHGSRLTNWYSILAQGLRIAPPEAPVVSISIFNKHNVFKRNNFFCAKFRRVTCSGRASILQVILSEKMLLVS